MNFYSQKELRGVPTILGHAGQIAINLSILRNCFIKIFTEPVEEKPAEEEKSPEEEKQPEIEEKEKSPERKEKSPEKEKKGEKGQQPQPVVPEPAFLDFNETVKKLIDLYLLKSSPFYFVLPNDVFDKIKAIDENISTIDDIWKVENEDNFKNIINLIFETNLQASIDPVIEMVLFICFLSFSLFV